MKNLFIKRVNIAVIGFCVIILISCSPKANTDAPHHFIIVSIDALHPSAISEKYSPFIFSLKSKGVSIQGESIQPPLTLYNHTAMFTGLNTKESGLTFNRWYKGDTPIKHETFFNIAYEKGLNTAYFYSKQNLGYLVTKNIKTHKLSEDSSIADAGIFIESNKNTFTFLHVSGLDFSGKKSGWLSQPYMKEFSKIDSRLRELLSKIIRQKRFVIIITSDHAGHDKIHGSNHPDDSKLPFIFYSDYKKIKSMKKYRSNDLKKIVENLLEK